MNCHICDRWTPQRGCAHYKPAAYYHGRGVGVLLLPSVQARHNSGCTEQRYIHNVEGMRTINYEPAPTMQDVERVIEGAQAMTAHNQRHTHIILTRDGYLYYTQDTPGYCDGEITVTIDQLKMATPTTTVIY